MVGFMGHNLFLDCRDEVKHTLGVVVANVLEEGFIWAVAASFESTWTLTTLVLRHTLFLS